LLNSGLLHLADWWKFTDVSEVLAAFIIRAIRSSSEDSHLDVP
jgi:hypothetical protein